MPKLYGAPAYARPPIVPVNPIERPFDPDELPLQAERSDDDEAVVDKVDSRPSEPMATTATPPPDRDAASKPDDRPLRIRLPGRTQSKR